MLEEELLKTLRGKVIKEKYSELVQGIIIITIIKQILLKCHK